MPRHGHARSHVVGLRGAEDGRTNPSSPTTRRDGQSLGVALHRGGHHGPRDTYVPSQGCQRSSGELARRLHRPRLSLSYRYGRQGVDQSPLELLRALR